MKLLYCILLLALVGCVTESNDEPVKVEVDTTKSTDPILDKSVIEISFLADDSLLISGHSYFIDDSSTVILLCHQAGKNLHEYDSIYPILNDWGFNCIAIDQRAGGIVNGIVNQTADRALDQNATLGMVAAKKDILAGIDFAYDQFNRPIVLWGSSYSASLALHIAEKNEKVAAVVAFSPGDYFENEMPPLVDVVQPMEKPFFITCAKRENNTLAKTLKNRHLDSLHVFHSPETSGAHGSKALNLKNDEGQRYWDALNQFLILGKNTFLNN